MLIRTLQRLRNYLFPSLRRDTTPAPNPVQPVVADVRAKEVKEQQRAQLVASVGDITTYTGDAIVNAANSQLMAGGGVCGAIFKVAGLDALQEACDAVAPCSTGDARTTPGFALPAKFIIHAVGPIYTPGQDNAALLGAAYKSALREAVQVGAKTIAFPAISTGIYGYPLEDATEVAVKAVDEFCRENPGIERVDFVCFAPDVLTVYQRHLWELENAVKQPATFAP